MTTFQKLQHWNNLLFALKALPENLRTDGWELFKIEVEENITLYKKQIQDSKT